ncbi:hypothetical protein KC872_05410 [Candidatus Kaiserbacteria bacterium]|nr:hypothetical protein [Candidatus Kaiserbacteria bacterium]
MVDFTQQSKIVFDGVVYPRAHTIEAKTEAFEFHKEWVQLQQESLVVFCFGGCDRVGDYDTPPIRVSLDFFKKYWPPTVLNTRELYESVKPLSESSYSQQDWTLVVIAKNFEDTIFVQTRLQSIDINNIKYHLYSVSMVSAKSDIKIAHYAYAVEASEDFYCQQIPINRYFQGENEARERCVRVLFPDPCLCRDFDESLKDISRYAYIIEGW